MSARQLGRGLRQWAVGRRAPPGEPALLDLLTVSANAAFSYLTRLRASYSGAAVRVRRVSPANEADFGFVGNEVDLAGIAAFCAGTDGFVTKWYDQSGNGRDLAQANTSKQPRIATAGVLSTLGSKAAIAFDGTDDFLSRGDACGISGNPAIVFAATGSWALTSAREAWNIGTQASAGNRIGMLQTSATELWNDLNSAGTRFLTSGHSNPNYYVHGHPPGGNVASGFMRKNGAALSLASAQGSAATNIFNSKTTLGCYVAEAFFTDLRTNAWMLFSATIAGADLATLEAALADHL